MGLCGGRAVAEQSAHHPQATHGAALGCDGPGAVPGRPEAAREPWQSSAASCSAPAWAPTPPVAPSTRGTLPSPGPGGSAQLQATALGFGEVPLWAQGLERGGSGRTPRCPPHFQHCCRPHGLLRRPPADFSSFPLSFQNPKSLAPAFYGGQARAHGRCLSIALKEERRGGIKVSSCGTAAPILG